MTEILSRDPTAFIALVLVVRLGDDYRLSRREDLGARGVIFSEDDYISEDEKEQMEKSVVSSQ